MVSTRRHSRLHRRFPISPRRTRIPPSPPGTPSYPMAVDIHTPPAMSLELDDIQRGVLHPRPTPYAGTYLLLRIDERRAGRELIARLLPAIDSAGTPSDP